MAQIQQYEATPAATEFTPKLEGINSLQQTSEQLRRVAQQSSAIAHQTGQEIDRGLSQLGAGVTAWEKAAKKQNSQDETVGAMRALSDTKLAQQKRNLSEMGKADPSDTGISMRQYERDDAEIKAIGDGLKTPKAKLWFQEHYDSERQSNFAKAVTIQGERGNTALDAMLTKNHANDLAQIAHDPSLGYKMMEQAKGDITTLVGNFADATPEHKQKVILETLAKKNSEIAYAMVDAYSKKDPVAAAKMMQPGGELDKLMPLIQTEERQAAARGRPEYWTREIRQTAEAGRQDINRKIEDNDVSKESAILSEIAQPNADLAALRAQVTEYQQKGVNRQNPDDSQGMTPKRAEELGNLIDRRLAIHGEYHHNTGLIQKLISRATSDPEGLSVSEIRSYGFTKDEKGNDNGLGWEDIKSIEAIKANKREEGGTLTNAMDNAKKTVAKIAGFSPTSFGTFIGGNDAQRSAGDNAAYQEQLRLRKKQFTDDQISDAFGNKDNPEYENVWSHVLRDMNNANSEELSLTTDFKKNRQPKVVPPAPTASPHSDPAKPTTGPGSGARTKRLEEIYYGRGSDTGGTK